MGLFNSGGPANKGSHLEETFGENGRIGAAGEQYYAGALQRSGIAERFNVHRSLSIPASSRDRQRLAGDVDFAVANGNSLALIDVKRWAANVAYWSIFEKPMAGFSPLLKNGEWRSSSNMQIAVERYSALLPGVNVCAMTVFVPTQNGAIPFVRWLRWPGGIESYRSGESFPVLYSFLGEPRPVLVPITKLLLEMQR